MMTVTRPDARVQVLPAPIASPGVCGICGKSSHPDGFADARLDFEWYGTFYLCADCVGDYARAFGYHSISDMDHLYNRIDELEAQVANYENVIARLKEALVYEPDCSISVVTTGDASHQFVRVSGVLPFNRKGDGPDSSEREQQSIPTAINGVERATEANGPISEQGSDGVSDDSSDESGRNSDELLGL